MAKLTGSDRANLPQSTFAGPGRSFRIPDKSHARAALSGASRAENVGNITAAQKATIDAKANAKLGHPRTHSLAMASATTLHGAGYITKAHKDQIHAHASKQLAAHKAKTTSNFGSMSPGGGAGHYMSTVNPGMDDEQGGM